MVMAPLFFISFFLPVWFGPRLNIVSAVLLLLIYILTELSDLLDGIIARKQKIVTDLGKVMDPFADTFSRLTYFICLTVVGVMPAYAFVIIMWREFGIVFLRMLMMGSGKAVAANIWGKAKAVLYAVSGLFGITYVAFGRIFEQIVNFGYIKEGLNIIFILAAIASLASFGTYVKAIIKEKGLAHLSR